MSGEKNGLEVVRREKAVDSRGLTPHTSCLFLDDPIEEVRSD